MEEPIITDIEKPKKKSGRHCRNPNCGWRIIEYPIWKGQEEGVPFEFKKINWYNFLIGDWTKALVLITVLLMSWAYWHDTQAVHKLYENPCSFVKKNYQPCLEADKRNEIITLQSNFTMNLETNTGNYTI